MLKEVPSTVVMTSPDRMTKGLESGLTSKKASPVSSTSLLSPMKDSGYFRLLLVFMRTLVQPAKWILSFWPHWVLPSRGVGWGTVIPSSRCLERRCPKEKISARVAAMAIHFRELFLFCEEGGNLGARGKGAD